MTSKDPARDIRIQREKERLLEARRREQQIRDSDLPKPRPSRFEGPELPGDPESSLEQATSNWKRQREAEKAEHHRRVLVGRYIEIEPVSDDLAPAVSTINTLIVDEINQYGETHSDRLQQLRALHLAITSGITSAATRALSGPEKPVRVTTGSMRVTTTFAKWETAGWLVVAAIAMIIPIPVMIKVFLILASLSFATWVAVRGTTKIPVYSPKPESVAPDNSITVEQAMMQQFINIHTAIKLSPTWNSDSLVRAVDLEAETSDITSTLRELESLSKSIDRLLHDADDDIANTLKGEQQRLNQARIAVVDRLAALDRYRVSLDKVEADRARVKKLVEVSRLQSEMDQLEYGKVSSEMASAHAIESAQQLEESIQIANSVVDELSRLGLRRPDHR